MNVPLLNGIQKIQDRELFEKHDVPAKNMKLRNAYNRLQS